MNLDLSTSTDTDALTLVRISSTPATPMKSRIWLLPSVSLSTLQLTPRNSWELENQKRPTDTLMTLLLYVFIQTRRILPPVRLARTLRSSSGAQRPCNQ